MINQSTLLLVLSILIFVGCAQPEETKNANKRIQLSPEKLAEGKVLYTKCAVCHGHNAEGVQAFNSPALANQETWYLKQQLQNFLNQTRGTHPNDSLGAVMVQQAKMLETEDQLETVIAYIKLLPRVQTDQTIFGDVERGKHYYNEVCASCHGIDAKGLEVYLSPNLLGIQDYYMAKQIRHFRDGIREIAKGDTIGERMIEMLADIPDDQAIDDVITYIHTLQTDKPTYY